MITALATVVSVEATTKGNKVGLSCEQQTSCSHCSSQKSCGTGLVSKAIGNKTHKWELMTDKLVEVGQTVEIGLSEQNLVKYASIIYLLPILGLILGATIAELFLTPIIQTGEGVTILLSVGFMGLGILLAKYLSRRLQSGTSQSVSLIRVLGEAIEIK
ncbi:SoxR reducing system RseC family protein [Vibrio hannami]|uniref:SoxR reducing system RseC family protein n=1 Tax=Vibrio hannami TaxID=2717094 RepID=UPI00240FC3DF|nr:SoxR reducing system RseC family protein [Vibrio hannami]MDG3087150.1 SoxR reducing system RseC family protein [Vibrio hannami]